jgi:hypothetical protein
MCVLTKAKAASEILRNFDQNNRFENIQNIPQFDDALVQFNYFRLTD